MDQATAEKILLAYRELDEETEQEYGYKITGYLGPDADGHTFNVICDDGAADYEPVPVGVYPPDTVLFLPR